MCKILERAFIMNFIPKNNLKVNRKRGSATLYSLFIAMIILTVAIGFNWVVREHLKASLALSQKMSAMLSAYSAYQLLLFTLIPGKVLNREIELFEGEKYLGVKRIPLNGTEVFLNSTGNFTFEIPIKIALKDSNGLISLITFRSNVFDNLLKYSGVPEEKRRIILDSFLDWIDHDDFTRLNGAEKPYYEREGKPIPRNFELQFKEELLMIRGMDRELYEKISPYLTMLPNPGFNPNTAPPEVLRAYLDLEDNATFKTLLDYLSNQTLLSDSQLFNLTGRRIMIDEGVYYFPSYYFELLIYAGFEKPLYTLISGLDLRMKTNTPYEILYWKEN
jgi:general secretion pathway protein K